MKKNIISINEQDIQKMVRSAVQVIKEELNSIDPYWKTPEGNEEEWEKVDVDTSKKDNTDPFAEMSEISDETKDILGKSISGGKSGVSMSKDKHDMDNDYKNPSFNDKSQFKGWGDSIDNIVDDEIKKSIKEIRKRK